MESHFREFKCVICACRFKDVKKVTAIPCGHTYHTECIRKALKVNSRPSFLIAFPQVNPQCPMCRRVTHLDQVMPSLFFAEAEDASTVDTDTDEASDVVSPPMRHLLAEANIPSTSAAVCSAHRVVSNNNANVPGLSLPPSVEAALAAVRENQRRIQLMAGNIARNNALPAAIRAIPPVQNIQHVLVRQILLTKMIIPCSSSSVPVRRRRYCCPPTSTSAVSTSSTSSRRT